MSHMAEYPFRSVRSPVGPMARPSRERVRWDPPPSPHPPAHHRGHHRFRFKDLFFLRASSVQLQGLGDSRCRNDGANCGRSWRATPQRRATTVTGSPLRTSNTA